MHFKKACNPMFYNGILKSQSGNTIPSYPGITDLHGNERSYYHSKHLPGARQIVKISIYVKAQMYQQQDIREREREREQ